MCFTTERERLIVYQFNEAKQLLEFYVSFIFCRNDFKR